ncbi:alpha-latrotoxin-Lhe1a-like [Microplitis demolitor]|uniref:alpha-latrotoxin-Lhe1a-like n=1 Tax=Microplitis demolitor TaxID=69319 RepID=UPI00235B6F92|nr:alpha-latrotoxin-Lhe1a-like [Microplitis demolitor]
MKSINRKSKIQKASPQIRELMWDIRLRNTESMKASLEKIVEIDTIYVDKSNPNLIYGSLLHVAAEVGNFEAFKLLIDRGANIHTCIRQTEETVLHHAVQSKNHQIVEYLLKNGVNVNVKSTKYSNHPEETALHLAVRDKGSRTIVRLLLEYKADVNVRSKRGVTPIILAIRNSNVDAMRLLFQFGADINWTYKNNGKTLSIFDAVIESINVHDVLFCMIEFLVNKNHVNNINNLPLFQRHLILHQSVKLGGQLKFISTLIHAGIDTNTVDADDKLLIECVYALSRNPHYIYFIKQHIVRLLAAGFYVCERNIKAIEGKFDDYFDECHMEVIKMKNEKIAGSSVSFLDVLHKDYHYLAVCLKNTNFDRQLDLIIKSLKFSIYNQMIIWKLRFISSRIKYLKSSEEYLYNVFYELRLPDPFVRKLYFYLANDDLKLLF